MHSKQVRLHLLVIFVFTDPGLAVHQWRPLVQTQRYQPDGAVRTQYRRRIIFLVNYTQYVDYLKKKLAQEIQSDEAGRDSATPRGKGGRCIRRLSLRLRIKKKA